MIEPTQKFCKRCEKWLDAAMFQPRRLKCMTCQNAARRASTKASAKRREYYRKYKQRESKCRKLMPSFVAIAQALINGETARAERLAKIAYANAIKEGIA